MSYTLPEQDAWRTVVVDDRIPVDLFGRPLVVGVRPLQLWPLLLSKAILKVMAALRVTDLALPHQVFNYRGRVGLGGPAHWYKLCFGVWGQRRCLASCLSCELSTHDERLIHMVGCACVQVAAFCALTGWPQEDLLDPLAGPQLLGGCSWVCCRRSGRPRPLGTARAGWRNAGTRGEICRCIRFGAWCCG